MRILIAEDDKISRRTLQRQLEQWGHEVLAAEDGGQAWELLATNDCPVVITDWMMPVLSGPDLVRAIRRLNRPEYTYVILLTSRAAPGEIEITLPDLRSRLRAIPPVLIEMPDEGLIRSVLVKLFSDRQLVVEPHIVNYLALHMDRSMDQALRVVAVCDRLSLSMQRKVTRAVAASALAKVAEDVDDADGD